VFVFACLDGVGSWFAVFVMSSHVWVCVKSVHEIVKKEKEESWLHMLIIISRILAPSRLSSALSSPPSKAFPLRKSKQVDRTDV